MEKVRQYLAEATLCRMRAETAINPNVREIFLEQAETWDRLAVSREWLVLWQQGTSKSLRQLPGKTREHGQS